MKTLKLDSEVMSIIEKKIQMIKTKDEAIYLVGPVRLPVRLDSKTHIFHWYSWLKLNEIIDFGELINRLPSLNLAEFQQSSVLVYGDFEHSEHALVRLHSICHTGDIFGSERCDCGFQLKQSFQMIVEHGSGAIFYLANHEGRGIGLFSKTLAYVLQENGYDTVDANLSLGFQDDERKYDEAIQVLKALRTKPVSLITNNPNKLMALRDSGMNVIGRTPLWGGVSKHNEKYLKTKIERSGHLKEGGSL